ncbi:MAG: hypothetical protein CSA58_07220 [Micrococcales bacterium]|nr:MAG: hypothetical protein CSA58_07220 [Micrococcales bacterium]
MDAVCERAQDVARQAAEEIAQPGAVGGHVGTEPMGERLVTHRFACTRRAYRGWQWAVTVARAPRAKNVTVCEVELLAGPESLIAPEHVPWEQRLRPGDLGPGDELVRLPEDHRLESGFEATGEQDVDEFAFWELGLGRLRVLSNAGRVEAAQRWHDGAFGPQAEMAKQAAAHCFSCGFMMPVTGALRPAFGVCANEWSPADGRVVSLHYGCGAHSETDRPVQCAATPLPPVLDDDQLDQVDLGACAPAAADGQPGEGAEHVVAAPCRGGAEPAPAEPGGPGQVPRDQVPPGIQDVPPGTQDVPPGAQDQARDQHDEYDRGDSHEQDRKHEQDGQA